MPFATNDIVEILAAQFHAVARVRNVTGGRMHVALEEGYLPWIDDPVIIRRAGDATSPVVDARIVHVSGSTATIELVAPSGPPSDAPPPSRDTTTDEA